MGYRKPAPHLAWQRHMTRRFFAGGTLDAARGPQRGVAIILYPALVTANRNRESLNRLPAAVGMNDPESWGTDRPHVE